MRKDPVMDLMVKAKDFAQNQSQILLIVVGVVLVSLVGYWAYNGMQKDKLSKAQDVFGKAMIAYEKNDFSAATSAFKEVIESYPQSPHAAMSAFLLGDIGAKMNNFDDAISWYEKASRKASKTSFIEGAALEGLATNYESKGDIPKAIECFEKAAADPSIAYRTSSIRWKLALLNEEIKQYDKALSYCSQIVSDTSAQMFRQKAENLKIEIENKKAL